MQGYDIIGDIHGHHRTLEALLGQLGYVVSDRVWRHSSRKVVFLGDFIDRGPGQQETLAIVRPMVDQGAALAVMGNHEFNAIAWATIDPASGDYLRPHSEKNRGQHEVFLDTFEDAPAYADAIDWFRNLPLWLDLGNFRVIHACWEQGLIDRIREEQDGSDQLGDDLLIAAGRRGTWQYDAIETLLKGKEIPLPEGGAFHDKDGNERHNIRVRWWDGAAGTYRDAFMGPASARTHIPDDPIDCDHLVEYAHDFPPVFIGHYWLEGELVPLAPNIACLDYSVAKPGGSLVAYSWDGETRILREKFTSVARVEP